MTLLRPAVHSVVRRAYFRRRRAVVQTGWWSGGGLDALRGTGYGLYSFVGRVGVFAVTTCDVRIRPAVREDLSRILALNREWEHFLSPLDAGRLGELHEMAAYHRVAVANEGDPVAFLLAFREGADYGSPNYQWFERAFDTFLYIDRIVVDGAVQAAGVGRLLYHDILEFARVQGIGRLVCEVDIDPPNPVSRRFHRDFGFREIGRHRYGPAAKEVALQLLET